MKLRLNINTQKKLQEIVDKKGFSSIKELIYYLIEREIKSFASQSAIVEEDVQEALKRISGLGYI